MIRSHIPLVGTPDEEFASEARICGKYAFDCLADGYTDQQARDMIRNDAAHLASIYELSAADFERMALARYESLTSEVAS